MHCNRSDGHIDRPLVAYSGVSKPNLKMRPTLCCVVACSNKQRKGVMLRFFRIPSAIRNKGAYSNCLSTGGNLQYATSWATVCFSQTYGSSNEKNHGGQMGTCFLKSRHTIPVSCNFTTTRKNGNIFEILKSFFSSNTCQGMKRRIATEI